MKSILKKYGFDGIWHFTDRSNIESIKTFGGLLSLGELERLGVNIPRPGGNQWSHDADKVKGMHEYVHLAFLPDHPMLFRAKQEGRIPEPVWLKINPCVMFESSVRYCAGVSNRSDAIIIDSEEAKLQIDFDVLFKYMDWRDPEVQIRRQAALKSEILVPNFVPIEKIIGLKNG